MYNARHHSYCGFGKMLWDSTVITKCIVIEVVFSSIPASNYIKMSNENREHLAKSHAVNKDDIKFYEIIQNLMTALPLPSTE